MNNSYCSVCVFRLWLFVFVGVHVAKFVTVFCLCRCALCLFFVLFCFFGVCLFVQDLYLCVSPD